MAVASPLVLKIGAVAVAATSITTVCFLKKEDISVLINGMGGPIDKVSSKANLLTLEEIPSGSQKFLILKQIGEKKDKNIQDCKITPKNKEVNSLKNHLEGKIGTSSTSSFNETHKKYRRGLLWKCYKRKWNLTENSNRSELFDFSHETLTNEEEKLINKNNWDWSNSYAHSDSKTVIVTVSPTIDPADQTNVSTGTCKVTGTSNVSSPDNGKLGKAIEGKIITQSPNRPTWRKNFLEKCKRSYDEQIVLKIKSDDTWEKLEDLFKGTL